MKYRFVHPDRASRASRPVHSYAMRQLLGVKEIPVAGLPARKLAGLNELREPVQIEVWVKPLEGDAPVNAHGRREKRNAHRVRCKCPGCGAELSAGRLFQHACHPKHAPSYDCDCADCRLTRVSNSNPHGYVYRRTEA